MTHSAATPRMPSRTSYRARSEPSEDIKHARCKRKSTERKWYQSAGALGRRLQVNYALPFRISPVGADSLVSTDIWKLPTIVPAWTSAAARDAIRSMGRVRARDCLFLADATL